VRGDFVALQDSPNSQTSGKQANNYRQRDRYLGSQQPSSQQSNGQADRQQRQYRQQ